MCACSFSSLYQAPRTAEQSAVFKKALKGINLWYAHQLTTVWMVTEDLEAMAGPPSSSSSAALEEISGRAATPPPPAAPVLPYHSRGMKPRTEPRTSESLLLLLLLLLLT